MSTTQYDITPEALAQVKRLGYVVQMVLHQATAMDATTKASAKDVETFSRLMAIIDSLPTPLPGEDVTLSILTSREATAPYRRLQFGGKVIEIGDMQEKYDPNDNSDWTAITMFGAILGLGAGCRYPQLVEELKIWIDELLFECQESMVGWRIQVGNQTIGHMQYPAELDDE